VVVDWIVACSVRHWSARRNDVVPTS
jgi:hypothetical protein